MGLGIRKHCLRGMEPCFGNKTGEIKEQMRVAKHTVKAF